MNPREFVLGEVWKASVAVFAGALDRQSILTEPRAEVAKPSAVLAASEMTLEPVFAGDDPRTRRLHAYSATVQVAVCLVGDDSFDRPANINNLVELAAGIPDEMTDERLSVYWSEWGAQFGDETKSDLPGMQVLTLSVELTLGVRLEILE